MAPDRFVSHPANRIPEEVENHTPKFRGTWAPAELHQLLADGTIELVDFVLLQMIDSLVDARGEGCWASNDYLAKRIKMTRDYVKKIISKLKGLGLLRQVGWKKFNGRDYRVLETAWSRVDCTNAQGDCRTPVGGTTVPPWGGPQSPHILLTENTSSYSRPQDADDVAPPPKSPPNRIPSSNGNGKAHHAGNGTAVHLTDQFGRECADRLSAGIREKAPGELNPRRRMASWAEEFLRLAKEVPRDEIKETLGWYYDNMGRDYVPEAYCAKTFRSKYAAIRRSMLRSQRIDTCRKEDDEPLIY